MLVWEIMYRIRGVPLGYRFRPENFLFRDYLQLFSLNVTNFRYYLKYI